MDARALRAGRLNVLLATFTRLPLVRL